MSREHRKALLRCLIDKAVLRRTARDAAAVRIVWRGGEVSEMQVALPVNALTALPRGAEMEARVLELARAGVRDPEIVQTLAAQAIRLRHGIKAAWRCTTGGLVCQAG